MDVHKKILLVTPIFTHPNTPYPSVPVLAGFLRSHGQEVQTLDLSLETLLSLFSERGVRDVLSAAGSAGRSGRRYADAVMLAKYAPLAVKVLQGATGNDVRRMVAEENAHPGKRGRREPVLPGVKITPEISASMILDKTAEKIKQYADHDFEFSSYGRKYGEKASTMDGILRRLKKTGYVEKISVRILEDKLAEYRPDFVGITIPFPGTLLGAFRAARTVRERLPECKIVFGGGFVNSELRSMTDRRVFNFADYVCYDDGFAPWLGILGLGPQVKVRSAEIDGIADAHGDTEKYSIAVPDYSGIDFGRYITMFETGVPMRDLWTAEKWLKLQLTSGCYWHKCAFCDTALEYVCSYRCPSAAEVVDAMDKLSAETGLSGFHFVDEALPPALLSSVSAELVKRGRNYRWWGNIRFEKAFTRELCALMAESGCKAVCGGMECLNDRLLALMQKGVSVRTIGSVCRNMRDSGIMVHAYLIYDFPTQTDREIMESLDRIRSYFAGGRVHSAYWHRFALTVHSPMYREPKKFGIKLLPQRTGSRGLLFARNEAPYCEVSGAARSIDPGISLNTAVHNFSYGVGLNLPSEFWMCNASEFLS